MKKVSKAKWASQKVRQRSKRLLNNKTTLDAMDDVLFWENPVGTRQRLFLFRKEDLLADWELASKGEIPLKIEPLR